MSVKKPENFYEFCESLTRPYSLAKQYFDEVVLEIDVYNDSQYFYDWYSKLDDQSQDTTYNNLQRLYDVTKETTDYSLAQLKKRIPNFDISMNTEEAMKSLEKSLKIFKEFSAESIKRSKLSVLNQLLSQADSYKRIIGSVELNECEKRCNEHNKKHNEIKDRERKILVFSVLVSIIISFAILLTVLYFFAIVGNDNYIKFVNEYLLGLVIGLLVSVAGSIIIIYWNIIKIK